LRLHSDKSHQGHDSCQYTGPSHQYVVRSGQTGLGPCNPEQRQCLAAESTTIPSERKLEGQRRLWCRMPADAGTGYAAQ